jgi:hypothetical protein
MAAYALFWEAMNSLRDQARWVDHGGAPGLGDDAPSGLRQFKAGWATGTRTALLCGKILQPDRYAELVTARRIPATTYFPAYRAGEHDPCHFPDSFGTQQHES